MRLVPIYLDEWDLRLHGYRATYDGTVETARRPGRRKFGEIPVWTPVTQTYDYNEGYWFVMLRAPTQLKKFWVHEIIAHSYWDPHEPDAVDIDHRDGDVTNNSYDNIEWITLAEMTRRFKYRLKKFILHPPQKKPPPERPIPFRDSLEAEVELLGSTVG